MKILLTGVSGQVGRELRCTLAPLGELIAADRSALDLSCPDTVRAAVQRLRPDLIVNPAAYTAVDLAESEADLARRVNADAPAELAHAAAERGIPLVHFSTDYVFDGTQAGAYVETDPPCPRSVYGATKYAGEAAIQAQNAPHLIFRTAWVYGLYGRNFLRTIQRLAAERDTLSVVNDQFSAPTWARMVAEGATLAVSRWLTRANLENDSGVYHLTCQGRASWHDFAQAILADCAQRTGKTTALHAIPSTAWPTPAARPANSQLDSSKLANTFGVRLPDWQAALALCLESAVD